MKFFNHMDDQNRFVRVEGFPNEYGTQLDTHGVSYLCMRKAYQELGHVMGLDKNDYPVLYVEPDKKSLKKILDQD